MQNAVKRVEIVIADGISQGIQQMPCFVRNRRGPDHIDHIGGHAPPVMQCFLGIGFFFGIPDPVLYISNDPFVIFSPVPCRKCQIDRCFSVDAEQTKLSGDLARNDHILMGDISSSQRI